MTAARTWLPTLTPLRGVAALAVVAFHCLDNGCGFTGSWVGAVFRRGYLGVDFFFLLSGFVMAHRYRAQFPGTVRYSTYWAYIGARLARVIPLYFAVFAVSVVIDPNPTGRSDWAIVVHHLALLQSFGVHDRLYFNVPGWSLAAEWWCYFLVPFALASGSALPVRASALLLAGCWGGVWGLCQVNQGTLDTTFALGFWRCLCGVLGGVCLYRLFAHRWGPRSGNAGFLAALAALGLGGWLEADDLVLWTVFCAIISFGPALTGWLVGACNWGPVTYLGTISFSIYIVHWPLLFQAPARLSLSFDTQVCALPAGPLVTVLAGWVLTIGAAGCTYALIEAPAHRWLQARQARGRPGRDPAVARTAERATTVTEDVCHR